MNNQPDPNESIWFAVAFGLVALSWIAALQFSLDAAR